MDKEVAKAIAVGFSNQASFDALMKYADYSIGVLQKSMEQANDLNLVFRLQGSIAELRKLKKIRDYAMLVIEKESK